MEKKKITVGTTIKDRVGAFWWKTIFLAAYHIEGFWGNSVEHCLVVPVATAVGLGMAGMLMQMYIVRLVSFIVLLVSPIVAFCISDSIRSVCGSIMDYAESAYIEHVFGEVEASCRCLPCTWSASYQKFPGMPEGEVVDGGRMESTELSEALALFGFISESEVTGDELARRFRILVKEYHSDVCNDTDDMMKEINRGRDLLRNYCKK